MKSAHELLDENGGVYTITWDGEGVRPSFQQPAPKGLAYIADKLNGQYLWRCRNCQWHTFTPTDEPLEHRCGSTKIVRMGARLKNAFASIGITEERVEATLKAVGLPPNCGCSRRAEWLDRVDATLGLGERVQLFKTILGWRNS